MERPVQAASTPGAASDGVSVVLAARRISKRYGTVQALADVSLQCFAGEVHAVLGENGAGKTTLMRIFAGEEVPDAGEVRIDGQRVDFRSPADARAAGIGMVHQHFALVDSLTVAENLALSFAEPGEWRLRPAELAVRVRAWAQELGLELPPLHTRLGDLPVGTRQRLEILKALRRASRVLILDEPTAVLTPQETQQLFAMVRQLRTQGRAVLFITHKLAEVQEIADRITVLRQGRVVAEMRAPVADLADLARAMVGQFTLGWSKPPASRGGEVLALRRVTCEPAPSGTSLRDISFTLHAGEVLGIAGVDGNGQRELFEVLAGLRPPTSGQLCVAGKTTVVRSPKDALSAGLGLVPPDRRREGLVLEMTVLENLLLHDRVLGKFTRRGGRIDWAQAREYGQQLVEKYGIRAGALDAPVATLSGGNQQRTILARELAAEPRVLVAVNPTRGLDFAATQFVYAAITEAVSQGAAAVLISTDLDEIVALSDRVAVLYRGRLSESLPPPWDPAKLGALMAGLEASGAGNHAG